MITEIQERIILKKHNTSTYDLKKKRENVRMCGSVEIV